MKTYTKFLILSFLKSFFNIFLVMIGLVLILNILQEIEFFSNKNEKTDFSIYIYSMNTSTVN